MPLQNVQNATGAWPGSLSVVFMLALFVAACGTGGRSTTAGDQNLDAGAVEDEDEVSDEQQPVAVDLDALGASSWTLKFGSGSGGEVTLVDGWPITLTFDDGSFSGTAACNGYGGSYTIDGSQIEMENLGQNTAGCEPAVEQSERVYLAALQDVDGINLVADELALSGMSTELLFTRTEPAPVDRLVNQLWLLEATVFGGETVAVAGDPASLLLQADGTIVGETGCRSLTGSYRVVGNEIFLVELALEGDCPTALFDQDSRVVSVLGDGFVPGIDGETLTLTSAGNEGLIYRATTEDELATRPSDSVPSDAEAMNGVEWIFAGGDGPDGPIVDPRTVNPERMITLILSDDGYSGIGVCNSYGGEAEVGNGRVSFGPAAATKKGCGEPFNAIAAAYYTALPQMTEFGLEADGAGLVANGNEIELWFERADQ